jgi:ABC-type nitrate/sulfonate/bicarbonate transport system substrate-binding protein
MRKKYAVGVLLAITFMVGVTVGAETKTVNVALPSLNMLAIAFTTAKDRKFYSHEGLDVQLITMSAPVAIQALVGGNVEFATVSGAALPPIIRGAPIRIVFTSYFRPMFWLYSRPQISQISELKGKKVGVSGVGSGPALLVVETLKKYGLEGGRDVPMIALGAMPNIAMSLLSGAVDAAMIGPPFNVTVKEAGFRELVSFLDSDFVEAQGSITVRDELFHSNPALVEKFVRATYRGFQHSRSNRSDALRILTSRLKIAEGDAARYYDAVRPVMTSDGTLNDELQKKFIDQGLGRLGLKQTLRSDKVFDYSVVRKVRAELEGKKGTP